MREMVIGCDNAAFDLKQQIILLLKQEKVAYEDVGIFSPDADEMYPSIAEKVVARIISSNYRKEGILVCGTGIGMAIAANKFPGIYAAVCHDIYSAERARLSNDTNVMTLGSRVIGPELAKKIVREWLNLEFKPGSSSPKVDKIKDFEKRNFKSG
jgi:ribose 5-phosphate isomerase B